MGLVEVGFESRPLRQSHSHCRDRSGRVARLRLAGFQKSGARRSRDRRALTHELNRALVISLARRCAPRRRTRSFSARRCPSSSAAPGNVPAPASALRRTRAARTETGLAARSRACRDRSAHPVRAGRRRRDRADSSSCSCRESLACCAVGLGVGRFDRAR